MKSKSKIGDEGMAAVGLGNNHFFNSTTDPLTRTIADAGRAKSSHINLYKQTANVKK